MTRVILLFSFFLTLLPPLTIYGADIIGAEVQVVNDEVLLTTGLRLDERGLADLKNGISKEITFHVGVYRVWKNWPDEFVWGKKIVRTLMGDPVKQEFIATSSDGTTLVKKRFKDFDSMLTWALGIRELKLIHLQELQPARYFVRVTAESRLRKLPPVIGYLFFFVPEKEFGVTRDSAVFTRGEVR